MLLLVVWGWGKIGDEKKMKILGLGTLLWGISVFTYADNNIPQSVQLKIPAIQLQAEHPSRETIVSTYKKEFESKVMRAWNVPDGSAGLKATVYITLTDGGEIETITISNTNNYEMKSSIIDAINAVAPFTMPTDSEIRKYMQTIELSFTSR